jgi:hypothetical protein
MAVGSRIDEFCFHCAGLTLDSSKRFKCNPQFRGMDAHAPVRFKNPQASEVTIRPEGSASGIAASCSHLRGANSDELSAWRIPWLEYVKKNVAQQIEAHEKEASDIELYRLEFEHSRPMKGELYQIFGAKAKPLPLNKDALSEKKNPLVLVDRQNHKVLIRHPKIMLEGFGSTVGKVSGRLDLAYSTTFLRDLLKRDIASFDLEIFKAGEEPDNFKHHLL